MPRSLLPIVRVRFLLIFALALLPALPQGVAARPPARDEPAPAWLPGHAPGALRYVESSGGLEPPQWDGGRTEIELGDVNGDGNPDLVSIGDHGSPFIGTNEHGLMVWSGDGLGNWSVFQSGNFGYGGVALGDLNGDGLMDAAYAMHHNYSANDFGDQLIEAALGDGTGSFWQPWDDGLATNGENYGMFGTDVADVDNDGDLDLAANSFGCCSGIHVYLNQGNGAWIQSFGFNGGNSGSEIAFGDVNGDGMADLIAWQEFGTVFTGDGAGGFQLADGNLPPGRYDGRVGPGAGDVNNDGRDDLSFCRGGRPTVWTWTVGNVWLDLSGDLFGRGCNATRIYDMNGDGFGDVVVFMRGRVAVFGGDGTSNWTPLAQFRNPEATYSALHVGGDADHNGFPDIAVVAEGARNHPRFYKEASVPAVLRIRPVAPHGGETFYAGSVQFVDWISAVPTSQVGDTKCLKDTSCLIPGRVTIELSVSGPGGPWQVVGEDLPDNGRYQWVIPGDSGPTTDASLRFTLTTSEGTAQAQTAAPFTILAAARP